MTIDIESNVTGKFWCYRSAHTRMTWVLKKNHDNLHYVDRTKTKLWEARIMPLQSMNHFHRLQSLPFSTVHVKLKQKAYTQNGKCYIWYHTLILCLCKHHKLNSWKINWTYVIFPWVWNMFCFEPNFMNFIVQALFFVWVPFSNFCTFLYWLTLPRHVLFIY